MGETWAVPVPGRLETHTACYKKWLASSNVLFHRPSVLFCLECTSSSAFQAIDEGRRRGSSYTVKVRRLHVLLARHRHTHRSPGRMPQGSQSDSGLPGKTSSGEIVLTQDPEYIAVSPGEDVVIHCTASADVTYSDGDSGIHWYQKKADQPPKLLFYWVTRRQSGVPERFISDRSGSPYNDFTLTIRKALTEDEAEYICQQSKEFPLTQ